MKRVQHKPRVYDRLSAAVTKMHVREGADPSYQLQELGIVLHVHML